MNTVKVYACGNYKTKPEEQELCNKILELETELLRTNPDALVTAHKVWRELFELPNLMFSFGKNVVTGHVQMILFPVRPGTTGTVKWDPNRCNFYLEIEGK